MSKPTEFRIITDGKRFRAQVETRLGWMDIRNEYRFGKYVGAAYRWRWQARYRIWRQKRRYAAADAYSRKKAADENAVWERER